MQRNIEGNPNRVISGAIGKLEMKVADADQGTAIPAVTEPKLLSLHPQIFYK